MFPLYFYITLGMMASTEAIRHNPGDHNAKAGNLQIPILHYITLLYILFLNTYRYILYL